RRRGRPLEVWTCPPALGLPRPRRTTHFRTNPERAIEKGVEYVSAVRVLVDVLVGVLVLVLGVLRCEEIGRNAGARLEARKAAVHRGDLSDNSVRGAPVALLLLGGDGCGNGG